MAHQVPAVAYELDTQFRVYSGSSSLQRAYTVTTLVNTRVRTICRPSWSLQLLQRARKTRCKGIGSQVHCRRYGRHCQAVWVDSACCGRPLLHLQEDTEADQHRLWSYRSTERRVGPLDKDRRPQDREIPVRCSFHMELLADQRMALMQRSC